MYFTQNWTHSSTHLEQKITHNYNYLSSEIELSLEGFIHGDSSYGNQQAKNRVKLKYLVGDYGVYYIISIWFHGGGLFWMLNFRRQKKFEYVF